MNSEVAFKYKMSSMQAALGLAQLERIDELIARKRQIFHWYRDEIEGHAWQPAVAVPASRYGRGVRRPEPAKASAACMNSSCI